MAADDLGFDPNALRDKYRAERDKRLRAEANEQYVEIAGQFEHYLEDPYIERVERAPVTDDVEVVVIGGGFGGQLVAARLREAGVDDIRIIEKGGDFGGTLRTFDPALRKDIISRIEKTVDSIAGRYGGSGKLEWGTPNPVTTNDPALTAKMKATLSRAAKGKDVTLKKGTLMTAYADQDLELPSPLAPPPEAL